MDTTMAVHVAHFFAVLCKRPTSALPENMNHDGGLTLCSDMALTKRNKMNDFRVSQSEQQGESIHAYCRNCEQRHSTQNKAC